MKAKEGSTSYRGYEDYSEDEFEEELDSIEATIQDLSSEAMYTSYDNREAYEEALDSIKSKLYAMEDYLTDEQYDKAEELHSAIRKAYEVEYDGPSEKSDPYSDRGLRQSDFY